MIRLGLSSIRAPGRLSMVQYRSTMGLGARLSLLSAQQAPRLFHTRSCLQTLMNPVEPDEPHKIKIRRPGKAFAEPMDPKKQLGMHPIYTALAGHHVAFTRRAAFGFLLASIYAAYVVVSAPSLPNYLALVGLLPVALPIPLMLYLTRPYVTRIFRLYNRGEPQTYENITEDETLVVETVSMFGRSLKATEIKLKDIRLANERNGWVNWVYTDEASGEVVKLYVADNVGGIKMDRIWGIIEKNSGVDNGRGFLDQR
uniref:ARAD1D36674p n=1 Tax=Blastobotrys adeninivorans TaxID=409370 RepID=A0A060TC37_BLAAD